MSSDPSPSTTPSPSPSHASLVASPPRPPPTSSLAPFPCLLHHSHHLPPPHLWSLPNLSPNLLLPLPSLHPRFFYDLSSLLNLCGFITSSPIYLWLPHSSFASDSPFDINLHSPHQPFPLILLRTSLITIASSGTPTSVHPILPILSFTFMTNYPTSSNILHDLALPLHSGSLYFHLFLISEPSFLLSFLLTPFFSSSSSFNFIHGTCPPLGSLYLHLFLTGEPPSPTRPPHPLLLLSSSSNFIHGTFDACPHQGSCCLHRAHVALLKGR